MASPIYSTYPTLLFDYLLSQPLIPASTISPGYLTDRVDDSFKTCAVWVGRGHSQDERHYLAIDLYLKAMNIGFSGPFDMHPILSLVGTACFFSLVTYRHMSAHSWARVRNNRKQTNPGRQVPHAFWYGGLLVGLAARSWDEFLGLQMVASVAWRLAWQAQYLLR